jgi:DNA-binding transcriptional regulator YiaG
MARKKYRSKIAKSIHELASGLYKIGLMDKQEMLEFDRDCLSPSGNLPIIEPKNIGQVDTHYAPMT